jgi:hypothetical protein
MKQRATPGLRAILFASLLLAPVALRAQSWQWAAAAAGSSTSDPMIARTVVDATGRVYAAGSFSGTVTLGGTTLTSAGGTDGFLGRLSPSGAWERVWQVGGPADDQLELVVLDGAGGLVVSGGFESGVVAFGSMALSGTGAHQVFVARLDAGGSWTQAVAAEASQITDLEVAPNQEVVTCGNYNAGQGRFDSLTLPSRTVGLFVARLSPAGTWTQAVTAAGDVVDFASALSLAPNGDVVVVGETRSNRLSFGTIALPAAASAVLPSDGFVAYLSAAGTWTQATRLNGVYAEALIDVALTAAGETVVLGSYSSPTLTLGGFTLSKSSTTVGDNDLFVARRDAAGTWTQAVTAGGPGIEEAHRMAVASNGDILVGGDFGGPTARFGALTLTNTDPSASSNPSVVNYSSDAFVARLSPAGTWTEAVGVGGLRMDLGVDLALDAADNVYLNGTLGAGAVVAGLTTAANMRTAFVAKLGNAPLAVRPGMTAATGLLAWPNPAFAGARAGLRLPAPAAVAQTAVLLDALGRPVRQLAVPARATDVALDLTGLAPGLYLLRVGAATGRLVVQ